MSFKYSVIIPHCNFEYTDTPEQLLKSIPNENRIEVIIIDGRRSYEIFEEVIKASNLDNISSCIMVS